MCLIYWIVACWDITVMLLFMVRNSLPEYKIPWIFWYWLDWQCDKKRSTSSVIFLDYVALAALLKFNIWLIMNPVGCWSSSVSYLSTCWKPPLYIAEGDSLFRESRVPRLLQSYWHQTPLYLGYVTAGSNQTPTLQDGCTRYPHPLKASWSSFIRKRLESWKDPTMTVSVEHWALGAPGGLMYFLML